MPEQELRTKALCAGLVLGTTAAVCALKLFQRAASTQNIQGNAAVIADDGSMDELKVFCDKVLPFVRSHTTLNPRKKYTLVSVFSLGERISLNCNPHS